MSVTPGFKERLLDAMRAAGLKSAEDLATAIHIPLQRAQTLLETDLGVDVDAVTLFRICDITQFSGRWLLRAELPPSIRIVATPDEHWILDKYRAMSDREREIIHHAIKNLAES